MAKKLNETVSCESQQILALNCQVVGEFCIENFRFLIISTDNLTELSASFNKIQSFSDEFSTVLGHFDYGNRCYLIVKIESRLENSEPDIASLLTERELQIAALIAVGWPNKQVALQLGISEWTVSAHLRRIFIKLNVDSRAAMVYRCSSLIHLREMGSLNLGELGSLSEKFKFD